MCRGSGRENSKTACSADTRQPTPLPVAQHHAGVAVHLRFGMATRTSLSLRHQARFCGPEPWHLAIAAGNTTVYYTRAMRWVAPYIALGCLPLHVERCMPAVIFDLCPAMFLISEVEVPVPNSYGSRQRGKKTRRELPEPARTPRTLR